MSTPHPQLMLEEEPVSPPFDTVPSQLVAFREIHSHLQEMREELNRLRERDAELTFGARRLDEQLRLAGEIQRDLLPAALPDTSPLTVHTLYLPADHVSGDTYDLAPLDEHRFGLSIADATGHGMAAALLTILVRNSLRGSRLSRGTRRILEPDEVLVRLNAEVLGAALSQCQFITGLHAILDRRARQIRWARGGVPYPILVRRGQPPRVFKSKGGLVGAWEGPSFEVVRHQFLPGEILLFYTDGLEALLLEHHERGPQQGIAACPWIDQVASDHPEAAFEHIRRLAADTPHAAWPRDDITVIAVRWPG